LQHSADGRHGPFGAVICKNEQIIAEGWNKVVSASDPTAHAEITAIRRACKQLNSIDLSGCTIYCSCEPCPMCLAAIYWAKLDKIVFAATHKDAAAAGFNDSYYYEEIGKSWEQRTLLWKQELRDEGRRVFEAWCLNPNKVEY